MKKLMLFSAAAVAFAFTLQSCKKDRVCECTYNGTTQKVTFNEATKRQAKDACLSQSYDLGGGQSVKIECELK
jgi:hypothetical protein